MLMYIALALAVALVHIAATERGAEQGSASR